MDIVENDNHKEFPHKDMTIDEIIKLLADVRTELWILKKTITSEEIKKELKYSIAGIDVVGCELSQNIKKKLEKS